MLAGKRSDGGLFSIGARRGGRKFEFLERDDDHRLAIIAKEEPRVGLDRRWSGLAGVAHFTSRPHRQIRPQVSETRHRIPLREIETFWLLRGGEIGSMRAD